MILDPIAWWLRQIGAVREPQTQEEIDPVAGSPIRLAANRVLRAGRSVSMALDANGAWHLRRRAKQLRRLYGTVVTWRAMPRDEPAQRPPRRRLPWWFI